MGKQKSNLCRSEILHIHNVWLTVDAFCINLYGNYVGTQILKTGFTTNYLVIRQVSNLIPQNIQNWLFWGFAISFFIKVPLFPLHTWLPDAHTEAPTPGSVVLAGVLLKMGTYGLIRYILIYFLHPQFNLGR
jgi:NADH-quinone oxidoreductase subunit M